MKITLVIPAHNEEEVIANTIISLESALTLDYEIIVVNDHSQDKTASVVNQLTKQYPNLKLVDNDIGRGFADALRKGFAVSDSDLIIPIMADLCDDPKSIRDMYDKIRDGFSVVCGSRYMKGGGKLGGPLLQSFFSRFVGITLRFLIGIPTLDVSNSFKCYRKSILDNIQSKSKGFEISMELALEAYFSGASITEIPTVWKGRSMGKSKFYLFRAAPKYLKLYLGALVRRRRLKICQGLY